jgi:DNA repair protein RadC
LKKIISLNTADLFPPEISELTVIYRRSKDLRIKVTSAEDAVEFARKTFFSTDVIAYCEKFFVLFIDHANQIYAWKELSSGGLSGTVVDPRLIFQTALLCHASGIIMMHNHPSDNIQPSESDKNLTLKIVAGGRILEIRVLDHIILTLNGYFSFADEGLL